MKASLICYYLYLSQYQNKKDIIKNFLTYIRKNGKIIFPNGFTIQVNKNNFKDIFNLYIFSLKYGVEIGKEWKYDKDKNIIITPDGIKFTIKGFDHIIFAETFLYDIHFIDYDLTNKIVIHGGAYVGDTALYYAKKGAIVYAFEPQPSCYKIALENLELNPELKDKIILKNYVIGDDGEIEFPDLDCHGGASYYTNTYKKVKVRSVSISTILREFNIKHPNILDLDIKGNEFKVIEDKALEKFDIVRIEYSTIIDNKKIGNRDYLIEKLKEYGFNKIRIYKHNELFYDLSAHGTILAQK
ncbi:hypothetical protein YN1_7340 [Nanoarchaeota archaeon]